MNRKDRLSDSYRKLEGPLLPEVYVAVSDKYDLPLEDETVQEIAAYYIYGDDEKYIAGALLKARAKINEQRIDKKTGALEENAFREEVSLAIERQRVFNRASDRTGLVLVTLDAEEFKQVNEKYGHPAGDEVLRGIVEFAKSVARIDDGDLVGRIGGDEFAILLNFDKAIISPEDFIKLLDERMAKCPLDRIANLSGVRWNHAILDEHMTDADLFRLADVKGEEVEIFVRAHSKTDEKNQNALELALSRNLANLK